MSNKGPLFEDNVALILDATGFRVVKKHVKVGAWGEIDLLAKDLTTGQNVCNECKNADPETAHLRQAILATQRFGGRFGLHWTPRRIGTKMRDSMDSAIREVGTEELNYGLIDGPRYSELLDWVAVSNRTEHARRYLRTILGIDAGVTESPIKTDPQYPYHPSLLDYLELVRYLMEEHVQLQGRVRRKVFPVPVLGADLDTRSWFVVMDSISSSTELDTAASSDQRKYYMLRITAHTDCPECAAEMRLVNGSYDVGFNTDIFNGKEELVCKNNHHYFLHRNLKTIFAPGSQFAKLG